MRSVPMVARRYSPVTSPMTSRCALARPNTFRVGSPDTTSRKWWESTASARQRCPAYLLVALPTSAPNSGMSGRVAAIVSPASGSARPTRTRTATGTTVASTSCGRYLAK